MKPDPKRLLFLDAETFYDSADNYTLKKLTPVEYILDNRFELILMAVKEGVDGKGYVVDGPDFPRWVKDAEPHRENTATVNWNALFDASICAWRYGYVPGRMLDAMTMCRAILGHDLESFALANVAKYFKLPPKGDMVQRVDGLHRSDIISRGMWEQECAYAIHDNELCAAIWQVVSPKFPWAEQRLQDLVIRCTVDPQLYLDKKRLYAYYTRVRAEKERLLQRAGGVIPAELMSANKFAELLASKGVIVERKVTKAAAEKYQAALAEDAARKPQDRQGVPVPVMVPALARTDTFMQGLVHHENPEVAALAAARLGHKSTLEETRCKRLLKISMLQWPYFLTYYGAKYIQGPLMPVPLRYAGAHTHRLSGDWGLNEQNMKRGSELRYAHVAPKGHSVIVADSGQIECRLNAWICGEKRLLQTFRDALLDAKYDPLHDPYNRLATAIFGRSINRKLAEDMIEGFIGKTGTLGLGYGCGADRFYSMVLELSYIMGIDLGGKWTHVLAQKAVDTYRDMNPCIVETWRWLNDAVTMFWAPGHRNYEPDIKFGPVTISPGCILGPNGLEMRYAGIHTVQTPGRGSEWNYRYGKMQHKMYGAKMLENIVQFLARIIVMNTALRLNDRGYRFCLQAHDELVFVVPNSEVDKAMKIIHEEMVRPPSWAKDLPLAAEVKFGRSYGEAK